MSFLFRGRNSDVEQRFMNVPFNISDGSMTHTIGVNDGVAGALRLAPLFAAVGMIADSVSTCPWAAYNNRDVTAGGQKMRVQPGLITDPGAFKLTLSGWKSQCVTSLLLRGNAYGINVASDGRGTPTKVQWLHPDWVRVDEQQMEPRYYVQGKEVDSSVITHVQGITLPGSIVGLAPLTLFRKLVQTGLRVEDYKHGWYDSTSVPRGVFFNKSGTLTAQQASDAKEKFKASVQGHDVLVTGNDWSWQPLAPTAADAQFVEATQLTATQIAAIYHVPPEEIGGRVAQALTYKTLEANSIKYVQQAVHPWLHRISEATTAILPNPQFVVFDEDALIRTELGARMAAYQVALNIGALTQDRVREMENEAPMTDAEHQKWKEDYAGKPLVNTQDPTKDPAMTDPTMMKGEPA